MTTHYSTDDEVLCEECGSEDVQCVGMALYRCNNCGWYFDTEENEPEPIKHRKESFDDDRGY